MSRPVCFCLVLSLIMLLVPAVLIPFWVNKVKKIESEIKVYASGQVENVLLNQLHKAIEFGFMLTISLMVSLAISIVTYVILTIRSGKREKSLSAQVKKQKMKATQEMKEVREVSLSAELINRRMEASQEMKEVTVQLPEVDGAYHLRQKDVFVDMVELSSENLPLTGKKILLIEDDTTSVTISQRVVYTLGATTYICRNVRDSVDYVCKILRDQRDVGPSTPSPPFDYILIDFEKLNTSAFAATVCIRKDLSYYGFQIPIMALTVHSNMEVIAKISDAEMDYYLPKPLKPDLLLEAIDYLEYRRVFRRS